MKQVAKMFDAKSKTTSTKQMQHKNAAKKNRLQPQKIEGKTTISRKRCNPKQNDAITKRK